MRYIQYAIAKKETGNASGKAKKDAFDIALSMGFKPSYHPSQIQKIRVIQQIITLPRFMGEKIIFFQYPAVSDQLMTMFRKILSQHAVKIALIHDLTSIQGLKDQSKKANDELNLLNIFDCLIVHNERMEEYVKKLGYSGHIVRLNLFDYLHDPNHTIYKSSFSNSISFAGNLEKAGFLSDLGLIDNCNFILYGIKGNREFSNINNVSYKGLLPSDEIQYLMEGDYGLVWDGDSLETCSGPNGEYLKYNNPHKLSLCIAAGKPVITWESAAIAEFVKKNHIGITVKSLYDLQQIDLESDYGEMKQNVMNIKQEIAKGKYLQRAIKTALDLEIGVKR